MNYSPYRAGPAGFSFPPITPAVKWILLACVVLFFLDLPFNGRLSWAMGARLDGMLDWWGLGSLRVLTYMWFHGFGDPWHLISNALMLYFFGTMAEARLGYRGTLKFFLAAGVLGGILFVATSPLYAGASSYVVGASGGAIGIVVYCATWRPRSTVLLFFLFPVPIWLIASLIVGLDFYFAWIEAVNQIPGTVARNAHLGGAIMGFVACRRSWFIDYDPYSHEKGLLQGAREKVEKMKQARTAAKAKADAEVMDRLLDKIQKEGMASLTSAERKFMERASKRMKDR